MYKIGVKLSDKKTDPHHPPLAACGQSTWRTNVTDERWQIVSGGKWSSRVGGRINENKNEKSKRSKHSQSH